MSSSIRKIHHRILHLALSTKTDRTLALIVLLSTFFLGMPSAAQLELGEPEVTYPPQLLSNLAALRDAALAMLVRTVALENRDAGVTANVVLPATMDTPANRKAMPNADFSKWLQPSDVADLVLWLSEERAGHVTGTAIPIDSPTL